MPNPAGLDAETRDAACWVTWQTEAIDGAAFLFAQGFYATLAADSRPAGPISNALVRNAFRSGKHQMLSEYAVADPRVDPEDQRVVEEPRLTRALPQAEGQAAQQGAGGGACLAVVLKAYLDRRSLAGLAAVSWALRVALAGGIPHFSTALS